MHALSQRETFARYDTEQSYLELTLSRLLNASDRDPRVAYAPRYLALKTELRAVEIEITVSREHYDDIALYYNARLSEFAFCLAPGKLKTLQKPVFAELERPPIPPTPLHRSRRERMRV